MSEKRYKRVRYDGKFYVCDKQELLKGNLESFFEEDEVIELLNEQDTKIKQLNRLAETNEEQTLNIMTYLHNNHYEIWEEVNQKCFGDVND